MKKQGLIAGLILVSLGLVLITSSIAAAQTSDSFTVPFSDPTKKGKLKASLNYGSITVKGTARKDVLIKYSADESNDRKHSHKGKPKEGETSRDGLKRVGGGGMDLEVTESSNYMRVKSDTWNNKMNVEIEVPLNTDLQVSTYNDGDLIITNIEGNVELTNYNGEITALNISGSAIATTYNGDIKVTFDKVTDNTPMSYSTYNGDIDITFPATIKATVKVKTEQGDIYSGFDVNFTSSGPQKKETSKGVYKVIIDEWKKADINGGGAEISMKNYNGDVYIRKK